MPSLPHLLLFVFGALLKNMIHRTISMWTQIPFNSLVHVDRKPTLPSPHLSPFLCHFLPFIWLNPPPTFLSPFLTRSAISDHHHIHQLSFNLQIIYIYILSLFIKDFLFIIFSYWCFCVYNVLLFSVSKFYNSWSIYLTQPSLHI